MKAYFRKSLLEEGLSPSFMHTSYEIYLKGIDWSKSYVSYQPEEFDGREYNMLLLVDNEIVFVNSIDFDFEGDV